MKKYSFSKKALCFLLCFVIILSTLSFCFVSFAAGDFSAVLEQFPQSYRAKLTELHTLHPDWTFQALKTGLSFQSAVDAETGKISLVTNSSSYSDMLKSKNIGDYDYTNSKYIQKDAGFVTANSFTVSQFLDPRNYLSEEGIFQFEKLSFDSSVTLEDVELALKGTFMENATVSYYDADGKYIKQTKKYSTVIYTAGKTYNVNPCFIANRIRTECGANGSATTKGTDSDYPGCYNFFNVDAYDSANPSKKALASAQKRGWTSPEKAIMGGAEFISKNYISVGQFTNYLQRFNVNPDAKNRVYSHQYMTNIAAPAETSYSTYLSYKRADSLDDKRIFSIPVYENMSGTGNDSMNVLDDYSQTGTMNYSCPVRKEPTVYAESISEVGRIPVNTSVKILGIEKNITRYPDSFQKYPLWTKISFTSNSKIYIGYVYSNFVTLTKSTVVTTGLYTPVIARSDSSVYCRMVSNDARIATITDDNKINFLAEGSVVIYYYDSQGLFSSCKYTVVKSNSKYNVSNVKTSNISATGAKVSFDSNTNCSSYNVFVLSGNKLVYSGNTKTNSITVKSLSENTDYKVYVRGISGNNAYKLSAPVSFKTTYYTPSTPTGVTAKISADLTSINISWNKSNYASGYKLYVLDTETNSYQLLATTSKTNYSYTDEKVATGASFKVVAYRVLDEKTICSPKSDVALYTPPETLHSLEKVTGIKCTKKTDTQLALAWNEVSGANSYYIYKFNAKTGKYDQIATSDSSTYTATNLASFTAYKFKVKAAAKDGENIVYGLDSDVFEARTELSTPKNIRSTSKTTSLTLSWDKVANATSYYVYKYNPSTGKYSKIATVSGNSYTAKSLTSLTTYKFKVKAVAFENGSYYYGKASDAFEATTCPSAPQNLVASSTSSSSITLSWSKVAGVQSYEIYRYNSSTKVYEKIATTSKTTYKATGLSASRTYYFKVKTCASVNSIKLYSALSSSAKNMTRPIAPQNVKYSNVTKTSVTLSWSKNTNATSYRIYVLNTATGKYEKLRTLTNNSYTVTGLKAGKTYQFKIRTYTKTTTATYASVCCNAVKVTTKK